MAIVVVDELLHLVDHGLGHIIDIYRRAWYHCGGTMINGAFSGIVIFVFVQLAPTSPG